MENILIKIEESININEILGNLDKNIKLLEEKFDCIIVQRDSHLVLIGEDKGKVEKIIKEFIEILRNGENLDLQKVHYVIDLAQNGDSYIENQIDKDIVCYTHGGKPIKAKTIGQKKYIKEIEKKDVVFGIGPAGTGKTYLAVAMAIKAYKERKIQKIILTRPAVEAGERLGFLPGDLQEKVDPYLRPLYDALYEMLGREASIKLKEKDVIEIVPLAYMRGRTLNNAFIILDEAQNTTKEQMKMFLTRMGFGSKVIVTGDVTQTDLPFGKESGLVHAEKILRNVKDIGFSKMNTLDIVRHDIVKKIIEAYDLHSNNQAKKEAFDEKKDNN